VGQRLHPETSTKVGPLRLGVEPELARVGLVYSGVLLSSRDNRGCEMQTMVGAVDRLSSFWLSRIEAISYDSCACHEVTIRPGQWFAGLDDIVDWAFQRAAGGHNGIRFIGGPEGVVCKPRWDH